MVVVSSTEVVEMVTNARSDAKVSVEVVAIGKGWVDVVEVVTIDGKDLLRSDKTIRLYVADRLNVAGAKLDIKHT